LRRRVGCFLYGDVVGTIDPGECSGTHGTDNEHERELFDGSRAADRSRHDRSVGTHFGRTDEHAEALTVHALFGDPRSNGVVCVCRTTGESARRQPPSSKTDSAPSGRFGRSNRKISEPSSMLDSPAGEQLGSFGTPTANRGWAFSRHRTHAPSTRTSSHEHKRTLSLTTLATGSAC